MKIKILFLILLGYQVSFSQNRLEAVVMDRETGEPIEYADIYNNSDHTSSNQEGEFLITSENDSLTISRLGYHRQKTRFQDQNADTIFLDKKAQNLEAVVIESDAKLLKLILKNFTENYPLEAYSERFFLRSILRKNNEIVQLADFSGKLERQSLFSTRSNPMPRKNYAVEIENLRKAGIRDAESEFSLSSFEELFKNFISIYMNPEHYEYNHIPYKDERFTKLEFRPIRQGDELSSGYYIVDLDDKAFNEVHLSNSHKSEFKRGKDLKYRTMHYELKVGFKKVQEFRKYVIAKAIMDAEVEVITDNGEKIIYNVSYKFLTYDNFKDLEVNNNISLRKDIFRLKADYNSEFWNSQNHLLLTGEMEDFLKSLDDEENDFKRISNF